MKIGLLTLTPTENYGGILQTIALYSYLESQGHEVTLINKHFNFPLWKKLVFYILQRIPFQNIKNQRLLEIKRKQMKSFIVDNIKFISTQINNRADLQKLIEKERFDAVVVGSDQVWRYEYINDGNYSIYFLDFKVDFPVKKIAYAASFGKEYWEAPDEVEKVSGFLSSFDAVSVREKSGITVCKDSFNVEECGLVLDPTLLVGGDFYNKFIGNTTVVSVEKKLVTYLLDKTKEKNEFISKIKKELEGESINKYRQINLSDKINGRVCSVEKWLSEIKDADFVITDSFHGMVFSILFNKQFLAVGNAKRGITRFLDTLNFLGLRSRLVTDFESPCMDFDEINYEEINTKLEAFRVISKEFLNDALL